MSGKSDAYLEVNGRTRIPLREIELRTSRSSGPGGQHASKTESRVEAVFDVWASESLGPIQKRRIADRLGPFVRTVSQQERSQARNRELALGRLGEHLASALRVERRRVATMPTREARERRLSEKRRRAELKAARRSPPAEE